MKVIKNAEGHVINIGEWDYRPKEQTALKHNPETGGYSVETEIVVRNPLPDGAFEDEVEVIEGYDGGLYLATDPRKDG